MEQMVQDLSFCSKKDQSVATTYAFINPLNAELNPISCLLALLGAHHFLHISRIRVKDPVRTAQ
jgi:hypothetical protein